MWLVSSAMNSEPKIAVFFFTKIVTWNQNIILFLYKSYRCADFGWARVNFLHSS